MAYNHMTVAEMITISGKWVDKEGKDRKLLASKPETDCLLPHLDSAHNTLLGLMPIDDSVLRKLSKDQGTLDGFFDDLVRGGWGVLTSVAAVVKDPQIREKLLKIRDDLFPTGLSLVKASYREEAGSSVIMKERMTTDAQALLSKLTFPGGTVLDVINELIETGTELGKLEDQRATEQDRITGSAPADILKARNRWIRIVRSVCNALELTDLDTERVDALLAPLNETAKAADLRAERRSKGSETPQDEAESEDSSEKDQTTSESETKE